MGRIPIVFVHGIRSSSTMWRAQVDAMRGAGHPVEAVDLPAHGTHIGGHFTIDAAIEAVDDAVDRLGGRVLLVGLSLGGYIAIAYAARRPERVAMLLASSCLALPRGIGLTGYRVLARAIRRLPDRGAWLNDAMARLALPAEAVTDSGAGGLALDAMDETLGAIGSTNPLDDLRRYPGPVWFVTGALDHFRLSERQFLAARPDAPLYVVRGATHLVSLVAPEAFTAIVLDAAELASVREAISFSPR